MANFYFLGITSWRGISFGATHWYGRISYSINEDRREIDLERPLSISECEEVNHKEGFDCFAPGDPTRGFNSREEVILAAKQWFQENVDNGFLLLGNSASADPLEVITGSNNEIVRRLNDINEKFKKTFILTGSFEDQKRQRERVRKEWDKIMNSLNRWA